jgi:hypothetical protein
MAASLAETYTAIVDSLPDDWTDLEIDLKLEDVSQYIDASTYLVQVNAQPYSKQEFHWRILIAHRFGHAASSPATHGTLKLLDDAGIRGELAVREVRVGRFETGYLPNRPESLRQEYLQLRNQ